MPGRTLLGGTLFVIACGSAPRPTSPARGPTSTRADGGAAPQPRRADARASFDDLLDASAARGLAEVERLDSLPDGGLVIKAPADACVRLSFSASEAVRASLVAPDGSLRGDMTEGITGDVPARGVACMRKGEALRFEARAVDGGAALTAEDVRVIVRRAP